MAVVVLDPRLREIVDEDVEVEKIAGGCVFTEGPVWHPLEKHLTYSDIYDEHGGTIYRWSERDGVSVLRRPSRHANGNTYDFQGNLLTCEHDRRITIMTKDGKTETLVDHYGDARLHSPNDLICLPDGDVLFTDPPYGLRQPDGSIVGQEYPFAGVFRYTPSTKNLRLLLDSVGAPNGLAVPDDGSRLYVCDTREQTVRVWDLLPDGGVANGRIFCTCKHESAEARPDGMKVDSRGNVYVASNQKEGIWVYDPEGTLLGFIGLPEEMNRQGTAVGGPANLAWGGDDWQTIYATAVSSVYRLRIKVPGQAIRFN